MNAWFLYLHTTRFLWWSHTDDKEFHEVSERTATSSFVTFSEIGWSSSTAVTSDLILRSDASSGVIDTARPSIALS